MFFSNMSESSEDEELLKALKEAEVDFACDLYSQKFGPSDDSKSKSSLPPSLRRTDDLKDYENTIGFLFTPGNQKYIAKHLTTFLDEQLEEVQSKKQKVKKPLNSRDEGIHLLKSSRSFVDANEIDDISAVHNSRQKRRKHKENNDEEMKKVKESAVSVDWILSGECLKGWEKNTRGEVVSGTFKDNVISKSKKRKKKKSKAVPPTVS